jgi:hypothetical protein
MDQRGIQQSAESKCPRESPRLQTAQRVMVSTQKRRSFSWNGVTNMDEPTGQAMCREVKQVNLLPGFAQSKSCVHTERYPHHITASHRLLSYATICHHLLREFLWPQYNKGYAL